MQYSIRVQGHLDPSWLQRFEGLRIEHQNSGTTLLSGPLPDQAALHGVLLQIIRLGLTLLSLETSEAAGCEETRESTGRGVTGHPRKTRSRVSTANNEDQRKGKAFYEK